jgi:hypothetical protein
VSEIPKQGPRAAPRSRRAAPARSPGAPWAKVRPHPRPEAPGPLYTAQTAPKVPPAAPGAWGKQSAEASRNDCRALASTACGRAWRLVARPLGKRWAGTEPTVRAPHHGSVEV